jgi:hypothetical protein
MYLEAGDELNLQYFTDNADMDAGSNINFDNPITYALRLKKVGN